MKKMTLFLVAFVLSAGSWFAHANQTKPSLSTLNSVVSSEEGWSYLTTKQYVTLKNEANKTFVILFTDSKVDNNFQQIKAVYMPALVNALKGTKDVGIYLLDNAKDIPVKQSYLYQALRIEKIPSLVVLDSSGTAQFLRIGYPAASALARVSEAVSLAVADIQTNGSVQNIQVACTTGSLRGGCSQP